MLTRHDDVIAATRHLALSGALTQVFVRQQLRGSNPDLVADYTRVSMGMMLTKDGQDQHRLRVIRNHAFAPSAPQR